jgi:hypothetical protein
LGSCWRYKDLIMPILASIPLKAFTNIYVDSVYVGGTSNGFTTERYTPLGASVLGWNNGATVNDIFVETNNTVYTVSATDGSFTTKKLNSNGQLIWGANHGGKVNSVSVNSSGNVATGGVVANGNTTRVYNSNGELLWSANHGAEVTSVAFDNVGNLYTGGVRFNNLTLRKYNSSGQLLWSKDTLRTIQALDFSPSPFANSVVVGMVGAGSDFQVKQYDVDGNLIATHNLGNFDNNTTATGIYCPKTNISSGGTTIHYVACFSVFNPLNNETTGAIELYNNSTGSMGTRITNVKLTDVVLDEFANIYVVSDAISGNVIKNPEVPNQPAGTSWQITRGAQTFCVDVNNKG